MTTSAASVGQIEYFVMNEHFQIYKERYNSAEFLKFCNANSIKLTHSPPYHPQSNGSAERTVQTAKNCLKKSLHDQATKTLSLQAKVSNFLFTFRNTPTAFRGVSPASQIFKNCPRTLLDLSIATEKKNFTNFKQSNTENLSA